MHNPTDRITHTTAFVTPVVEHWLEREIAQWVHHEGSIDDPSHHERTLLPRSSISRSRVGWGVRYRIVGGGELPNYVYGGGGGTYMIYSHNLT